MPSPPSSNACIPCRGRKARCGDRRRYPADGRTRVRPVRSSAAAVCVREPHGCFACCGNMPVEPRPISLPLAALRASLLGDVGPHVSFVLQVIDRRCAVITLVRHHLLDLAVNVDLRDVRLCRYNRVLDRQRVTLIARIYAASARSPDRPHSRPCTSGVYGHPSCDRYGHRRRSSSSIAGCSPVSCESCRSDVGPHPSLR